MDLGKIAESFGISATSFQRIKDAALSEVYIVDETHVLRSRSGDDTLVPQVMSEQHLIERVRTMVPFSFPESLFSKDGSPYLLAIGVLWTAYPLIPGTTKTNWWELHTLSQKEVAKKFQFLRSLHDMTNNLPRVIEEVGCYRFLDEVRKCLQKCSDLSVAELTRVQRAVEIASSAEQDSGCFVHGDFHPGNLLMQDEEVSGLIDTDWCRIGDGVEDAAFTAMMFLRNYETENYQFSPDLLEKIIGWYGLEQARYAIFIEYLILYAFYDKHLFQDLETAVDSDRLRSVQNILFTSLCKHFPDSDNAKQGAAGETAE